MQDLRTLWPGETLEYVFADGSTAPTLVHRLAPGERFVTGAALEWYPDGMPYTRTGIGPMTPIHVRRYPVWSLRWPDHCPHCATWHSRGCRCSGWDIRPEPVDSRQPRRDPVESSLEPCHACGKPALQPSRTGNVCLWCSCPRCATHPTHNTRFVSEHDLYADRFDDDGEDYPPNVPVASPEIEMQGPTSACDIAFADRVFDNGVRGADALFDASRAATGQLVEARVWTDCASSLGDIVFGAWELTGAGSLHDVFISPERAYACLKRWVSGGRIIRLESSLDYSSAGARAAVEGASAGLNERRPSSW